MRQAIVFAWVIVMLSVAVMAGYSCANIIPPQGGPKDSLPPVLLKADPPDSTVNFRGNKIVFHFDENLSDLIETQKNIIFSPTFDQNPNITVKGKVLTVPFQGTLLPNTTYVLNFGDAIADFN